MYDTTDTIAAIATPLGESGIGVIRISGSHAYAVGDAIFRMSIPGNPWTPAPGPFHPAWSRRRR